MTMQDLNSNLAPVHAIAAQTISQAGGALVSGDVDGVALGLKAAFDGGSDLRLVLDDQYSHQGAFRRPTPQGSGL